MLTTFGPRSRIILHLRDPNNVIRNCKLTTSRLRHLHSGGVPLAIAMSGITTDNNCVVTYITSGVISTPFTVINSVKIITRVPGFGHFLGDGSVSVRLRATKRCGHALALLNRGARRKQRGFHRRLGRARRLFGSFIGHVHPSLSVRRITANRR